MSVPSACSVHPFSTGDDASAHALINAAKCNPKPVSRSDNSPRSSRRHETHSKNIGPVVRSTSHAASSVSTDGVSADIMAAAVRAMAPHVDAVMAALHAYQVARAGDAAVHWGAEVERLRLELAAAERLLADAPRAVCTAHGLDVPPDPCDDAVDADPDQP